MNTVQKLHFIQFLFSDCELIFLQLDSWPPEYQNKMQYFIYNLTFPHGMSEEWKKLFKPCASQRLFIPVSKPYFIYRLRLKLMKTACLV